MKVFPNRTSQQQFLSSTPYQDLTIDLDDQAAPEPVPILQQLRQRPIRRTVRTAALTVAAAAALLVANALQGGDVAAPPLPAAAGSGEQRVRLIAPATATPGSHLVVLGHRNPVLCGAAELRFDGLPVRHKVIAYAGRTLGSAYQQVFMSMDLPRSATPGTHRIDLFGPVRSTSGSTCGDVPERQARIDTTSISISEPQI
ncbi:hypothetical protein AB0M20_00630 [Actinoplanes sp. NPDC051633]|uniref:hypothetical protein n=1 Tax=Actinoplanes sp. NPDC051633 TaxID=3155670 RepID=UPI0034231CED